MSSDMEKEPIIHTSTPLKYTEDLTLVVDVVERSDGRWSTRTEELFNENGSMEPVKCLKANLNESQKQDHPDLLLM